jgi:hypothetical protein
MRFIQIGVVVLILLVIVGSQFIRFDYAAGSHRIIPTAVDTDFWGNYKVYFRTTEFTRNNEEDHYFVERGNTIIADQIREAIRNNQEIVVYYERYIGFKGITAPRSSPIVRIEVINP